MIGSRSVLALAAVAVLVAAPAAAQVAASFEELQAELHGGERLRVTERAGNVSTGTLLTLSDHSLRLLTQGKTAVDLPESTVATIEHVRSHARRGVWIGLLSGAAAGMLTVAVVPDRCNGPCLLDKQDWLLPFAGLFGGIGAGVGAIIGAGTPDHRVILQAPPSPTPLSSPSPDP